MLEPKRPHVNCIRTEAHDLEAFNSGSELVFLFLVKEFPLLDVTYLAHFPINGHKIEGDPYGMVVRRNRAFFVLSIDAIVGFSLASWHIEKCAFQIA